MTAVDVDRWSSGFEDMGLALGHVPLPGPWYAVGECREHPWWLFFPERGDDLKPARAVCAGCRVQAECLEYALDAGPDLHGVWAGTGVRNRIALRGERARSAPAS